MKKTFAITIILTAMMAAFTLPAQSQGISSGIKGGVTMSNLYIDSDDLDDENARFGFHLGVFTQIMYLEALGLQPELLYTTKGAEANYEGVIDQSLDFNLNYLELPVLVVLRPVELLEIHAGPYLGLLLDANIEFDGLIEGTDELSRDNFKSLDYGLGFGLAVNLGNIQAGARYNFGLHKIADSDVAELLLDESKNSYGQLYIAFRLY